MRVDKILADKELQRQQAGGTFVCGIGNRVGRPTIRELLQLVDEPEVLFSAIKKPRPDDMAPERIVRGTAATAALTGDELELPPGAQIISRWNPKRPWHDTLVCRSATPLAIRDDSDRLRFDALHNLRTGKRIADQQITAVVRRTNGRSDHREYSVLLRATLIYPTSSACTSRWRSADAAADAPALTVAQLQCPAP